jgi:hypothetical protein
MSQIAASGGQPQKAPKYAPIYTGRFFNGINTNRSPLRAASAPHIAEKYYGDTSQDAMIAGSNIEVSNRLTLVRRPGNPLYDTGASAHTYNKVNSFDEFRVNKGTSDVFGTTLEQIFTMIDEGGSGTDFLYSLTDGVNGFKRGGDAAYNYGLKFTKSPGAGQSYMQEVGNTLYFANGVDNKKWLTSLFVRNSAGNNQNIQGSDGLAGTYPFGTFLVDPATGNLQQFIGITSASISTATVVSNVLTLTVTFSDNTRDYPIGTYFMLYGFSGSTAWLNGATIQLSQKYTFGTSTTLVAFYTHPDMSASGLTGLLIQRGTTGDGVTHTGTANPYVAVTGSGVPTYGTTVPAIANNFMGSITLDGNTVWINRGSSVENWGIKAPTTAPNFSVQGHSLAWQQNTYYSPASVRIDPVNGHLWQVTTAGVTGNAEPSWTASPTPRQKVVITSLRSNGTTIFCTTDTQSPALSAGDTVVFENMCAFAGVGAANLPDLNGVQVIVSATGLTTTAFQAPYTAATFGSIAHPVIEYGQAWKTNGSAPPTTITDGGVVWTCIQLAASLNWSAHAHYNVGDYIKANSCLFQLGQKTQPWITGTINMDYFTQSNGSHQDSDWQGGFLYFHSGDPATFSPGAYSYTYGVTNTPATTTLQSLWLKRTLPPGSGSTSTDYGQNSVNGAGEVGSNSAIVPGTLNSSWVGAITCMVFIPVAGTYTFSFQHNDGGFFAFDATQANLDTVIGGATSSGAVKNNTPQNVTAKNGFGRSSGVDLCGTNNSGNTGPGPFSEVQKYATDSCQWTFPQAGAYALEIDYAKWSHSGGFMVFMCPGSGGAPAQTLAVGRDISGTTSPSFPAFTTSGATYDSVNKVIKWGATVSEVQTAGQQYTWNNLGPTVDYVWSAGKTFTLPGTNIIDTNSNQEGAYETGITGTTQPSPWNSTPNAITADPSAPLQWINEGSIPAIQTPGNTITATSTQGWLYWIALVNTLDQTVSNVGPVSAATGQVVKGQITFGPGAGLNLNSIDPQADYVAIFRSTDGFTTPLLVPGFVNSPYTVPLKQYLEYGYVDTVPDTQLNNLLTGPNSFQNTPPASGAINLSYHLQRIWYSIGNTVHWTSGPLSPIGNGTDGTSPSNQAQCPSQIKRLVPISLGMLVFTVSDIFIIPGNGTSTSPILPAIPYLTGVGLANYNALDINGGLIGFYTTDKQFVIFNPSAGLSYVGVNIGDQFRLNNGSPGQSWNAPTVYVAYNTNGEDVGWYIADGVNGWYKLIATPAPEQGGVTWSPFASIQSVDNLSATVGVGAIKSVETSPGVHNLLAAQNSAQGFILNRDVTASTDGGSTGINGVKYSVFAVLGSIVLANSGQIAKVAYVTTESVRTGTPLVVSVILDEALPYYTGKFDTIKNWVNDPPDLPASKSFYAQRFYLSETEDPAFCRHLQIMIQWNAESALNELQTITIFGAYEVEQ